MRTSKPDRDEADTGSERLTALIAACQHDDGDAFRNLYQLFQPRVFRLAVRLVGMQDAADVTQQTFLQVFRGIASFRANSKFETWLFRIATNEALQFLRRNNKHKVQPLVSEPTDKRAATRATGLADALEIALSRINPDLRSVFLLKEVEGLAYTDIAEVLDLPEGTVGSRLNRARRELKNVLLELGVHLP